MANPQETLDRVGEFWITNSITTGFATLAMVPSASPTRHFSAELKGKFSPMGRWKKEFSAPELRRIEAMIGCTLLRSRLRLGQRRAQPPAMNLETRAARQIYRTIFETKWRAKHRPRALAPSTHPSIPRCHHTGRRPSAGGAD